MRRKVLDNNSLTEADCGVEYLYFLKGSQNVFLYRFLCFCNHRRRADEFVAFGSKCETLLRRQLERTPQGPAYIQAINDANQRRRAIALHLQSLISVLRELNTSPGQRGNQWLSLALRQLALSDEEQCERLSDNGNACVCCALPP